MGWGYGMGMRDGMGMRNGMEVGQNRDVGWDGDAGQDEDVGWGCGGDVEQPKLTGLTQEGGGMGRGPGLVEGLVSKEPILS